MEQNSDSLAPIGEQKLHLPILCNEDIKIYWISVSTDDIHIFWCQFYFYVEVKNRLLWFVLSFHLSIFISICKLSLNLNNNICTIFISIGLRSANNIRDVMVPVLYQAIVVFCDVDLVDRLLLSMVLMDLTINAPQLHSLVAIAVDLISFGKIKNLFTIWQPMQFQW